jgi:hypothetical protein
VAKRKLADLVDRAIADYAAEAEIARAPRRVAKPRRRKKSGKKT